MTDGSEVAVKPYHIQEADGAVEVWSGYRIQFGGMERHPWQRELKYELKEALSRFDIDESVPFVGYYATTDPRVADTENSLFTNVLDSMPSGVTMLRFERVPETPTPPVPVEVVGGHFHYYRYVRGGQWTCWQPDETIARWERVPRRVAGDGSARPAWLALREASASKLICILKPDLGAHANFGIRLTMHATNRGPRDAIANSEQLIDGTIAAFHSDRSSPELLAALALKFPKISEDELRRALDSPAGPLFLTPAVSINGGYVQISPADERCIVGELTIVKDSIRRCPELSGELFTVRPLIDSPTGHGHPQQDIEDAKLRHAIG